MNPDSDGELIRVVVDTNVYISAFLHPERPTFQIVQQAAEHRYRLLISPAIVSEMERVLRETFGLEERAVIRRLKTLAKAAEIIIPQMTLDVIREEPADNRILKGAVAGRAHLMVSGDRHLLASKSTEGFPSSGPSTSFAPWDFSRTQEVL